MEKLYRLIFYSPRLGMTFIRFAENKLILNEFLIERNTEEINLGEIKFWIIQENNSKQNVNSNYIYGNSWNTVEMAPEMKKLYGKLEEEANPELDTFKIIINLWQQQSQ